MELTYSAIVLDLNDDMEPFLIEKFINVKRDALTMVVKM